MACLSKDGLIVGKRTCNDLAPSCPPGSFFEDLHGLCSTRILRDRLARQNDRLISGRRAITLAHRFPIRSRRRFGRAGLALLSAVAAIALATTATSSTPAASTFPRLS